MRNRKLFFNSKSGWCVAVTALLFSCDEKPVQTDFTERILDVIIETQNAQTVQFPDLYAKTFEIPDTKDDKLILTAKLQARGFKITATDSAVQGLTGVRSVRQTLSKDGCDCEITKTYDRTAFVQQYAVSEKIRCE